MGEANVLLSLGEFERDLGRYNEARTAFTEARSIYQAVNDRLGQANVLIGLGRLERKLNRHDQARMDFHQAAHVYESLGMKDLQKLAVGFAEAM